MGLLTPPHGPPQSRSWPQILVGESTCGLLNGLLPASHSSLAQVVLYPWELPAHPVSSQTPSSLGFQPSSPSYLSFLWHTKVRQGCSPGREMAAAFIMASKMAAMTTPELAPWHLHDCQMSCSAAPMNTILMLPHAEMPQRNGVLDSESHARPKTLAGAVLHKEGGLICNLFGGVSVG